MGKKRIELEKSKRRFVFQVLQFCVVAKTGDRAKRESQKPPIKIGSEVSILAMPSIKKNGKKCYKKTWVFTTKYIAYFG